MLKLKYFFTALMLLNSYISFSMDIKQIEDRNENQQLNRLILDNNIEGVKKYIKEVNINPNIMRGTGWPALYLACYRGCTQIVKLLIEADADINIKNINGETALDTTNNALKIYTMSNVENKDYNDIKKLLLDRNQELLEELTLAIKNNDKKVMAKLLVMQSNFVDKDGNNFLHIASMMNNYEMVKFIVCSKLSLLNKKNNNGQTPLDENPEIILHLIVLKRLTLFDDKKENKKRKIEE